MVAAIPICLEFGASVSSQIRARITYAFRVFAAVFNYKVVDASSDEGAMGCFYGERQEDQSNGRLFHIPARYRPGTIKFYSQWLTRYRYAGEDFYLLHGIEEESGKPDWLGEIFEWISSSYELNLASRDSVGRIPYGETVFALHKISPRKPYATRLMSWLENGLRRRSEAGLPKAPSPIPGVEHLVVCSHDIDFYYTRRSSTFVRLFKNLGISLGLYQSWSYFDSNSRMILDLIGGKRVGDYLPALLQTMQSSGVQSTIFVVTHRGHRRDPSYGIDEISLRLAEATKTGFEVGLHGSYNSIVEKESLSAEVATLEKVTGRKALGSRQHWLRFDRHEKLFEAVENAGLLFDSSLGFAETAGFRNGASFAFPPYDFGRERPHEFLEIPLVLMDGSLKAASRTSGEDPQAIADEILGESRKWGWGGIAALWHNPVEPLSVPKEINQVFWNCTRHQKEHEERWSSAEQFLSACLSRYHAAGLLKGRSLHA